MITKELTWDEKIQKENERLDELYPDPYIPCHELSNEALDELK